LVDNMPAVTDTTYHVRLPGRASGFTVIEVLAAVAVLGVLLALASSSFAPLLHRWRIQKSVEDMRASLYLARSEAIRRGGRIGIQKNTSNCSRKVVSDQWSCGWFIFVDTNGNGRWGRNEPILASTSELVGVELSRRPSGDTLRFDRFGMANGANITSFIFSPQGQSISHPASKALCLASGGRIRIIAQDALPCV